MSRQVIELDVRKSPSGAYDVLIGGVPTVQLPDMGAVIERAAELVDAGLDVDIVSNGDAGNSSYVSHVRPRPDPIAAAVARAKARAVVASAPDPLELYGPGHRE